MKISKPWYEILKEEIHKPYVQALKNFLEQEKAENKVIYPLEDHIFYAFALTLYENVKVVIIGQDPYHGKGQAHGLSFSVPKGVVPPPSLKNIFKELHEDLKLSIPQTGCLIPWAKQGVFLLNATLTVRANEPKSHFGRGWETFTDAVIVKLAERQDPLIFLLWGKSAELKKGLLTPFPQHLVLVAPHPSPYSASSGFFGCRHFSKANDFLVKNGKSPIDWSLE